MKKKMNFKKQLMKYLSIKGLDIILYLNDGKVVELNKNRILVKDEIIMKEKNNKEIRIPISTIKYVDLFAA